jgi:hypothetical protein
VARQFVQGALLGRSVETVSTTAAAAVRGFFRIADLWGLGRGDQVERISHVLNIYGGLHAILGESELETIPCPGTADGMNEGAEQRA